ncbi:MAG: alpha/beta hydrolase [Hyphomicrobium sp.]
MTPASTVIEDITFTARDGLRLHARHYSPREASPVARRPVLCLPGLTRNGRDFHDLAVALSGMQGLTRDVYTLDYRGRGLSEYDPDWRNYAVPIEMLDVADFITLQDLAGCAIVGTSRGGLIAMILAAAQPSSFGPLVLNDIGPIIERSGLARISAYAGRIPLPGSWPEATKLVRDMNVRAFPSVPDDKWEQIARQWFNERNGRPAPGYDPKIGNSLSVLDGPIPALWPQFEALKIHPLMVLRGENSDILSAATVDEMRRRHPVFTDMVVKGQGHAPLLADKPSILGISAFLDATDGVVGHSLRAIA